MKSRHKILFMLLVLVLCAPAGFSKEQEDLPPRPRVLKPGDILNIDIWKHPNLKKAVIVDEEGYIKYSFLDRFYVQEKTVPEVTQMIYEGLQGRYIQNPSINVELDAKSQTIFVLGEVQKPGSYPYQTNTGALRAITVAGGFTDFAARSRVVIIRQDPDGREYEIKVNTKKLMKPSAERERYFLKPNDIIIVKRSWW